MAQVNPLEMTDAQILEEAHKLASAYKMKHTIRYGTAREEGMHAESVAEHVFGLIYLAQYFLRVEPIGASLDSMRVMNILLYHDFEEMKHGDVVTYYKAANHAEISAAAAKEVFEALPDMVGKEGYAYWQEYEARQTPEAQFAYAIDKMEPIFELLDPVNELSMVRLKVTFDMHVGNKYKIVEPYPVMKYFMEVVSEDMRKRDIFYKA